MLLRRCSRKGAIAVWLALLQYCTVGLKIFHVSGPERSPAISRALGNESAELPVTGSPVVPPAPSGSLLSTGAGEIVHRFIIAHKAACLKAEAPVHRGAHPQWVNPWAHWPYHFHISERYSLRNTHTCVYVPEVKKKKKVYKALVQMPAHQQNQVRILYGLCRTEFQNYLNNVLSLGAEKRDGERNWGQET